MSYYKSSIDLDDQDINLLLLGESGVGKSTFINSFANYIKYKTLDDAILGDPVSLIGSTFVVTDDDYNVTEIVTASDNNETGQAADGKSQTIGTKEHCIEVTGGTIRLIDTPGIGDSEGYEQDKKNLANIIEFLKKIDHLHGICILLKPNHNRLSVLFRFCLKELLVHLHKDAARNIVFCFTNTRSTFYKPGATLPLLQKILGENPITADIPTNRDTCYCFDNEAFRFMWAKKKGISFTDDDYNNFSASWDKSVAESIRLIEHLQILVPHDVDDTLSINDVRTMILQLTKPMADLSLNISSNIANLNSKIDEIRKHDGTMQDLKAKLHITADVLMPKELNYPRTVCRQPECVEYLTKPGSTEKMTNFITHCHEHCYLSGIEPETYPNPDLKQCWAMNGDVKNQCRICGCSWDTHMHITYENLKVPVSVIDGNVQAMIAQKRDLKDQIELACRDLNRYIAEIKDEQQIITNVAAQFGIFLKVNAMSIYNDALGDYLRMQIKDEKAKVSVGGSDDKLNKLETLLRCYEEEVRIIKEAIESNSISPPTKQAILMLKRKLIALKHNGKQLDQILKVAIAANEVQARANSKQIKTSISYRIARLNIFSK